MAVLVWRSSGPVARKRGAISRNWAGGGFARKRTKTKGIEQTSDESLCTTIHFHIQYILLTRLNLLVANQHSQQTQTQWLLLFFVTASFLQTHHLSAT